MAYLLISLLCVLAATKVTLQSRFSKTQNRSVTDSVFYNGIMFLTVATLFCPWLMANGATVTTIVFGVLMGILSVAFQLLYLCAFSKGKMSLTVILNNFSMIIPMAVSLLAFDEPFGLAKAAGTVLALVSFCLIVAREKRGQETEGKNGAAWLILTLLVFLVNGLISVNQKLYAESVDNLQVFEFVAVSYITAAALSFLILGVLGMREKRFPASGGEERYPFRLSCGACSRRLSSLKYLCRFGYSGHGSLFHLQLRNLGAFVCHRKTAFSGKAVKKAIYRRHDRHCGYRLPLLVTGVTFW